MKAIVVYESMFGSTHRMAVAIAEGLSAAGEVHVVRAADVEPGALEGADLLVVGCPTHAWSMPRTSTRKGAPSYVSKPGSDLTLEPGADTAPGVREWLASLPEVPLAAAAFDTRIAMSPMLTGRASRAISRLLRRKGARLLAEPESFLVDKRSHLLPGEADRARRWGAEIASDYGRVVATAG